MIRREDVTDEMRMAALERLVQQGRDGSPFKDSKREGAIVFHLDRGQTLRDFADDVVMGKIR